MFPIRLSIVTYNIWNTMRWPLRKPALGQFVDVFDPDILCLQELRLETQSFLDEAMPRHDRVRDGFPGWICEGNIYWKNYMFEEVEHGAEDIGIIEENRRLFWVRLKLKDYSKTLFVSTAHFTYQGHHRELETGLSPRMEQARRTVDALSHLAKRNEPAFFMGDLNDTSNPIRILHNAGYISCFANLGVQCLPTSPCYPTANVPTGTPVSNKTIDWILSNGHVRAIAAQVPHFYCGDVAPSDHWPVLAVYEIQP